MEERAERVVALTELLTLPRAALTDWPELAVPLSVFELHSEPFTDPDPFRELAFSSPLDAKRAIADFMVPSFFRWCLKCAGVNEQLERAAGGDK